MVGSLSSRQGELIHFLEQDLVDEPLAPWRPAAQAGHIGLRPGFIDEDQPPRVDEPLIGSPSFAVATYVRAIRLA